MKRGFDFAKYFPGDPQEDILYLNVTDHFSKQNKCLYFEVGDENCMAELQFDQVLELKSLIDSFVDRHTKDEEYRPSKCLLSNRIMRSE